MGVGMLDHFNIRTRKLDDTVAFYQDILGLENGARPSFSFPGAWMYSEGRPVVHLVDISPTSEPQKPDSGVVHHVAFASRDFNGMKARLTSKGIAFDVRQVPGGELWQIFVRDPNGVMIELNYEAAKEQG
jgi:catechol 2,3-dioxygenase-like lactoylglutathione lyase family enzyme